MTDDGLGSYYMLATASRLYFSLDQSEGDRVGTIMDQQKDGWWQANSREAADPMFITFTDQSGSEVRVRPCQIDALYTSTPASRARDLELRELRKSLKRWDDED